MLYKIGDKIQVVKNLSNHRFNIGDILTIFRLFPATQDPYDINGYDACDAVGNCCYITEDEIVLITQQNTIMKQMKDAVLSTAKTLLKANNTVTTLEIKTELRKTLPYFYWTQDVVSAYMNEFAQDGVFIYVDNGTFRVYSDPKSSSQPPSPKSTNKRRIAKNSKPKLVLKGLPSISRKKALELMRTNSGHFFTAVFVKKDGSTRQINGQYLKDQSTSDLGYVKVRESGKLKTDPTDCTRQINLQTLKTLKIRGTLYRIGK